MNFSLDLDAAPPGLPGDSVSIAHVFAYVVTDRHVFYLFVKLSIHSDIRVVVRRYCSSSTGPALDTADRATVISMCGHVIIACHSWI